jgi:hypothetical protein
VVGGADDIEGAVAGRAGDDHDGQAGGQLGEGGRRSLRAEQDDRLAAVLQQARDGAPLVAVGGNGAQRQLVAGAVGRRVEAGDQVTVEGVLHAEHHAEQATAAAAQQAGAGVGAVAQLVRGLQDPLPVRRARARGVADHDRHQGDGHPGPCRDVGEGRPPGAFCHARTLSISPRTF